MLPVVQDNVAGLNTKFEGRIHHMYLDIRGFVTVGVGNLLASASDAAKLAFTHGLTGPLATAAEITAAWNAVKASTPGQKVTDSEQDFYAQLTDLRLKDAEIDKLVIKTANTFDAANQTEFSNYPSFSADAQLGLISMRWPGAWDTFPIFRAHVAAGEWFGAAKQCFFDETNNAGLKLRNAADRTMFSIAGRIAGMGLDPEQLYYDYNTPAFARAGVNKLYLFKGGQYVRYDWDADTVDPGYPGSAASWRLPDPFSSGVDTVFNGLGAYKTPAYFGKTYFFRGSEYVRYDWDTDTIDLGPRSITAWGLTGDFATGIDAALNGEGPYFGKLYFFKGDQYVRYDWATDKIDQGPRSIAWGWELPAPFSSGIDAAVSGDGRFFNNKLYFFKGDQYIRCQWSPYAVDGAPTSIASAWGGLGALGFASDIKGAVNPPGRS